MKNKKLIFRKLTSKKYGLFDGNTLIVSYHKESFNVFTQGKFIGGFATESDCKSACINIFNYILKILT